MLFDTIRTASMMTDDVIVGFSGGKDSAVVMDLCFKHFKRVHPYFMYIVKDLEFQEQTLRYYESRYHTKILRVPHFMLSDFLKWGSFRMPDLDVPIIKTVDLYSYVRSQTGAYWIAGGERIADIIIRRAMIKKSSSIDKKRGRIYPLAYWNKAQVMQYVKTKKLPLSVESKVLGFSFRSLMPKDMYLIKKHFPDDFQRIKQVFPLIEASVKHYEYYGKL